MKYLGDFEKIGSVVTSRRRRPRRRDWLKSKKAERTADAAKNKNKIFTNTGFSGENHSQTTRSSRNGVGATWGSLYVIHLNGQFSL